MNDNTGAGGASNVGMTAGNTTTGVSYTSGTSGTQYYVPTTTTNVVSPYQFTAEDIEKARREERDKLYGRISKSDEKFKTLEEEIGALREAAAQRAAAEENARTQAEEAIRKQQEDELTARQLIEQREAEWQDRFNRFQAEQDAARAAYERDKQHLALKNYIERRAREEMSADNIAEELIDFINGNNEEEVENSITNLRAKTQRILDGIREGQSQLRAGMPGVSGAAAPPAGAPMDNLTGQTRQLTPEEIRNIPMSEWHKHRQSFGLTSADSNQGLY